MCDKIRSNSIYTRSVHAPHPHPRIFGLVLRDRIRRRWILRQYDSEKPESALQRDQLDPRFFRQPQARCNAKVGDSAAGPCRQRQRADKRNPEGVRPAEARRLIPRYAHWARERYFIYYVINILRNKFNVMH